ncbi:hypothetical protein FQV19_0012654, partial [Eudyptula minor]
MAAVCPSDDDPLHHLQRLVPVPVLLPAVHAHQGWAVLRYWNLPNPCWALRDERCSHLHSEAHGLAPSLGKHFLWLRLYPGVAGLPPGPRQRHRLRHPTEARVMPQEAAWRDKGTHDTRKRKRKLTKQKKEKKSKGINPPTKTKPTRPQKETLKGLLLIEDVYSIYGL